MESHVLEDIIKIRVHDKKLISVFQCNNIILLIKAKAI